MVLSIWGYAKINPKYVKMIFMIKSSILDQRMFFDPPHIEATITLSRLFLINDPICPSFHFISARTIFIERERKN